MIIKSQARSSNNKVTRHATNYDEWLTVNAHFSFLLFRKQLDFGSHDTQQIANSFSYRCAEKFFGFSGIFFKSQVRHSFSSHCVCCASAFSGLLNMSGLRQKSQSTQSNYIQDKSVLFNDDDGGTIRTHTHTHTHIHSDSNAEVPF